jgi:hypothetical protein
MTRILVACLTVLASTALALAGDLTVTNQSKYEIQELYVSRSNTDDWGNDLLGDETIANGGQFVVRNLLPGTYDLKVVDEDEDECVVEGVDLASNYTWRLTDDVIESCGTN